MKVSGTAMAVAVAALCFGCTTAAYMSPREAREELRLSSQFDEKELKAAYRARSLETHPDKGGTAEAFLRVSQAYETLQSRQGGRHGGSHGGEQPSMSQEEAMKRAEEMLSKVLDELLGQAAGLNVDNIVDSIFKPSDGAGSKLMGSFVKSGMRMAGRWMMNAVEDGSVSVTVNGQRFNGEEVKNWAHQLRERVEKASLDGGSGGSQRQQQGGSVEL